MKKTSVLFIFLLSLCSSTFCNPVTNIINKLTENDCIKSCNSVFIEHKNNSSDLEKALKNATESQLRKKDSTYSLTTLDYILLFDNEHLQLESALKQYKNLSININDKDMAIPVTTITTLYSEKALKIEDIDFLSKYGSTIPLLFYAIETNQQDTVSLLLKYGADSNSSISTYKDYSPYFPLLCAIEKKQINYGIVEQLINDSSVTAKYSSNNQFENKSVIFNAIERNELRLFNRLLEQNNELLNSEFIEYRNNCKNEYSPLMYASLQNPINESIISTILDIYPAINEKYTINNSIATPYSTIKQKKISPLLKERIENIHNTQIIFNSIDCEDFETAKNGILQGIDCNIKNTSGDTPLGAVIQKIDPNYFSPQYRDFITFLLKHKANTAIQLSNSKLQPLIYASKNATPNSSMEELALLLIDNDAPVNISSSMNDPGEQSYTPLTYAIINNDHTLVKRLLDHDANFNAHVFFDSQETTPLLILANRDIDFLYSLLNENKSLIKKLDINGKDAKNDLLISIALADALKNGFSDKASLLLQNLFQNRLDKDSVIANTGLPILPYVIDQSLQSVETQPLIEFLLTKNISINQKVSKGEYAGWTPLCFAIKNNNLTLMDFLIQKGANINSIIKTPEKEIAPIIIAFDFNRQDCAERLLRDKSLKTNTLFTDYGASNVTLLMSACRSMPCQTIRLIFEINPQINVNAQDSLGKNAFLYAAESNQSKKVLDYLEGKNPNDQIKTVEGYNALSLAVKNKQPPEIIWWLLNGHGLKISNDLQKYVDSYQSKDEELFHKLSQNGAE